MAKEPTSRERLIGTPLSRKAVRDVRTSGPDDPPPSSLLLGEYLAAIRRELESVALIAESDDPAVAQLHISNVEIDMAYGVEEVTDAGLRVVIAQGKLAEIPEALIHRVKIRLIDPAVVSMTVVEKGGGGP